MLGRFSPLSCRFWPLLTSLVVLVVLLQVIHMALLARLEAKEGRSEGDPAHVGRRHLQGRMLQTVLSEMEEHVINAHRLDRSGTYHVIDNFLTSEHVLLGRNPYDVSLVTQCSSNHLHHLRDLSASWNGPISVAIFTYDDDFLQTASTLLHLHFCDENIFRHVSFHLVYPISRAPKHLEGLSELKLSCDSSSKNGYSNTIENIVNMNQNIEKDDISPINNIPVNPGNYANYELAYPVNLLRNLGINYAQTPYIFLIDIDMVPSKNLRTEFQKFMASNSGVKDKSSNPKFNPTLNSSSSSSSSSSSFSDIVNSPLSAFVVPAFEIQSGQAMPGDKAQLLTIWLKGLARPFYWEACNKCHQLTNYERWRKSGLESERTMDVAYSVERDKFWEPFYIAKTSLPLYDERFKQYGYNRVSQVCEMHVAGFSFHVLDSAFVIHKGFKVPGEFHDRKDAENRQNRHLFYDFVEELKVKYPQATKTC